MQFIPDGRASRRLTTLILSLIAFGWTGPIQGALTVQHFWHVGEDNQILPTDSIGANAFTGTFGTVTVDTANFAPGSSASLNFANADGANWTDNAITVPAENWLFELWVNPTVVATDNGVSIATLGSEAGTTQIGMVAGKWFFGEMNVTYGENSQPATAGAWTHLAWVRDAGVNRFFVGGVEVGSNSDSLVNNGRIHLFIKPGGGEVPQGNVDEIRFSTFNAGEFNSGDLLVHAVPEPASIALLAVSSALFGVCRRRRG